LDKAQREIRGDREARYSVAGGPPTTGDFTDVSNLGFASTYIESFGGTKSGDAQFFDALNQVGGRHYLPGLGRYVTPRGNNRYLDPSGELPGGPFGGDDRGAGAVPPVEGGGTGAVWPGVGGLSDGAIDDFVWRLVKKRTEASTPVSGGDLWGSGCNQTPCELSVTRDFPCCREFGYQQGAAVLPCYCQCNMKLEFALFGFICCGPPYKFHPDSTMVEMKVTCHDCVPIQDADTCTCKPDCDDPQAHGPGFCQAQCVQSQSHALDPPIWIQTVEWQELEHCSMDACKDCKEIEPWQKYSAQMQIPGCTCPDAYSFAQSYADDFENWCQNYCK
jgi:hypothetical protein